jgi:hypothetical protein
LYRNEDGALQRCEFLTLRGWHRGTFSMAERARPPNSSFSTVMLTRSTQR